MGEHWWYHKFIDIEISRWAAILELWAIEKLVGMRNTRQSGTPISLSLSLSLHLTIVDPLLIRLWIDSTLYCHLQKPFQARITSPGFFENKPVIMSCDSTCVSLLLFISMYLSLSLSCLFAYVPLVEVHQKGMRISETSIAMLGQLAFRSSRHTWI